MKLGSVDNQAALARKILNASADFDGLTDKEANKYLRDPQQKDVLRKSFGYTAKEWGIVTTQRKKEFLEAGFSDSFINLIEGENTKKAPEQRVRFLTNHLETSLLRPSKRHNRLADEALTVLWLGGMGILNDKALFSVKRVMHYHSDISLRTHAMTALVTIEPDTMKTVPLLIEALYDNDEEIRSRAELLLGHLRSTSVYALEVVLFDSDRASLPTRLTAAIALENIATYMVRECQVEKEDVYFKSILDSFIRMLNSADVEIVSRVSAGCQALTYDIGNNR